jgi:hypothetical protein
MNGTEQSRRVKALAMGAEQSWYADALALGMQLMQGHQPEAPLIRFEGIWIHSFSGSLQGIQKAKQLSLQGTRSQPKHGGPRLIGPG